MAQLLETLSHQKYLSVVSGKHLKERSVFLVLSVLLTKFLFEKEGRQSKGEHMRGHNVVSPITELLAALGQNKVGKLRYLNC